MAIEEAGYGAGGSILGAALVFFGFRERLKALEDKVVYKDTCAVCAVNNKDHFEALDKKLDRVDEKLDKLLLKE